MSEFGVDAQRVAEIGHEFRNVLMVVLNLAAFVVDELPADSETRGDLAELVQAAERGAQLTTELLALARGEIA